MALNIQNENQLIALAQAGEPEAIAAILNYYFNEHNIWVKVGWEDTCLILLSEGLKLPPPSEIGLLFTQILSHLHIERGDQAILYGRIQGESEPCWHIALDSIVSDPILTTPSPSTEDQDLTSESMDLSISASSSSSIPASHSEPDLPAPSLKIGERIIPPTIAQKTAPVQFQEGDRFLSCVLAPIIGEHQDSTPQAVLVSVTSIETILHITAQAILPVPYMAPFVLGIYRYKGTMLWILDLWQQLNNPSWSDRPTTTPNTFNTLVLQRPHSQTRIGFALSTISGNIHHCDHPLPPDPSQWPEPLLPFIENYDPISHSPILSIEALIQDQRLQMHRA